MHFVSRVASKIYHVVWVMISNPWLNQTNFKNVHMVHIEIYKFFVKQWVICGTKLLWTCGQFFVTSIACIQYADELCNDGIGCFDCHETSRTERKKFLTVLKNWYKERVSERERESARASTQKKQFSKKTNLLEDQ